MAIRLKLDWHGDEVNRRVEAAITRGLDAAANMVLAQANQKVPHDTGFLQSKGTTHAEGLTARISYDTPYARRLHEHPEYDFKKGREGKWLERAIRKRENDIATTIADEVKKAT